LDHLLEAARAAGVRRFVAQSFAMWMAGRSGPAVKTEEDVDDAPPLSSIRDTVAAITHVESSLADATDLTGIALRYGMFYGPGTSIAQDGSVVEMIRKRRFPLVGAGPGVWSFIHIDDAAIATVTAIERGAGGTYAITDDEPAPVGVWLPELASAVGAPRPIRVPVWVAKLATGPTGVAMMTEVRGASNAKAKREFRWQPRFASWREGFRYGL
jgi:nucleoside-diphosphate-sugar epimerase